MDLDEARAHISRTFAGRKGRSSVADGRAVDMQHNGGIRPREIAQNKVLICCSKPLSDLTIDA